MFIKKVYYFLVNFFWLIGFVFLLLLFFWYRRPRKSPPRLIGLPFVGYLPFLSIKNFQSDLLKLRKKYRSIFSVRMGFNDVLFLNDYKSIEKALVKNGSVSSGRPEFPTLKPVSKGKGIVTADYDNAWKTQRKFGIRTLNGFGKKEMEIIGLQKLCYLIKEIQKNVENPFDISVMLHNAVSNMICKVIFGKRFDYNDEEFLKPLNNIIHRFGDPIQSLTDKLLTLNPFLKYVPPFHSFYKKSLKMFEDLFVWIEKRIEEHRKTYDKNNNNGNFIDAFLAEEEVGEDSSFTKLQLINYIHELLIAGTDTTSGALYWAILCLLHYPETQKKLRNEIKNVIGFSGTISMSQKLKMPYINAFIQEVMRFRTQAPLSFPHKATADFYLDDYFIPKGTQIISNIYAVHNDPDLWEDPEVFNPERFLDEQGNFSKSKYVIPFSIGPRRCLGQQLAEIEIFIFLVGMAQKFEFQPDPTAGKLPNITEGTPGFAFNPISYKIVAKEV